MAVDLFIIDGHNLAYRSYHALRPLSNAEGQTTHAVLGFVKSLRAAERRWKPVRTLVTFDGGLSPERLALCPEYKAQRPPMPPDLRTQISLIEEYLRLSNIPNFRLPDVEADDLIAGFARETVRHGGEVLVLTSDKDLCQLIDDRIRIVNPSQPDRVFDRNATLAKFGVEPGQLGDWLALTGDSSDNISGVPGIGPVTATRLIGQFKTLAALHDSISDVQPDRIRSLLETCWTTVERNRKLLELKFESDLPPWPEGIAQVPVAERNAFLTRLGLKSLLPPPEMPDLFDS